MKNGEGGSTSLNIREKSEDLAAHIAMASATGTGQTSITVEELLDSVLPALPYIPHMCRDINGVTILDSVESYDQLQQDHNIYFATFINNKLEGHPAVPQTSLQQILDVNKRHNIKAIIIETDHQEYISVILNLQEEVAYLIQTDGSCRFNHLTDFTDKWRDFQTEPVQVIKPQDSLLQVYLFTQCICWALHHHAGNAVNLGEFIAKLPAMEVVSMTNVRKLVEYVQKKSESHFEIMSRKMERQQFVNTIISTHLNMELIQLEFHRTGIVLTRPEQRYVERKFVASVFDKFVEEGVRNIQGKLDEIMKDIPMFVDKIREVQNAKGFISVYGMVPIFKEAQIAKSLASHTEKKQFIGQLQVQCLKQVENGIDEKLEEQEVLRSLDACIKCMCEHEVPFRCDMPLSSFSKRCLEKLVGDNHEYYAERKHEILSNLVNLKTVIDSCKSSDKNFLSKVKSMLEGYLKYSWKFREQKFVQISGSYVRMSKVISDIQSRQHPFIELRIYASIALFIDCDIHMPGVNIAMVAPEVIVVKHVEWDFSGSDAQQQSLEKAASEADGIDGLDGESGGNLLILSDDIRNAGNWIIKSNGGKGEDGQPGGDGKDGKDGKNGTNLSEAEFKTKFKKYEYPTFADFPNKTQNWISRVVRYEGHNKDGNQLYYQYHTKWECWKHSGKRCCYDFVFLQGTKGTDGERGGDGGQGGCGGIGGHGGNLEISGIGPKAPESPQFESAAGKSGEHGKPGKGGKGGRHGSDGMDNLLVNKQFHGNGPIKMLDYNKDRRGLLQKVYLATAHTKYFWWQYSGYWKGFYKATPERNQLKQAQNGFEGKKKTTSKRLGDVSQKNHISKEEILLGYDVVDIFAIIVSIHDKKLVSDAQKECAKLSSAVQQRAVTQQLQFDPDKPASDVTNIHNPKLPQQEIQRFPTPLCIGDDEISEIENGAIHALFVKLDKSYDKGILSQKTQEEVEKWIKILGWSGWTTDLLNKFCSGFQASSKVVDMLKNIWKFFTKRSSKTVVMKKSTDLHNAFLKRYRIVLLENVCNEMKQEFNTLLAEQEKQELAHYTSEDDVLLFKSSVLSKLLQEVTENMQKDTKENLDKVYDKTKAYIRLLMDRARYGYEDEDTMINSDEEDTYGEQEDTYSQEFEQRCNASLPQDIAFGLSVMHTCPRRGFKDLAEWILLRLSSEGMCLSEQAVTSIFMHVADNNSALAFETFLKQDQTSWLHESLLQLVRGILPQKPKSQDLSTEFEQQLKMHSNEALLTCMFQKLWKSDDGVDVKLLCKILNISESLQVGDFMENQLDDKPMCDWPRLVSEKLCTSKLLSIASVARSEQKQKDKSVYYCRKLLRENDEFQNVEKLIDRLQKASGIDMLNKILEKFACGLYPLNAFSLQALESDPNEWDSILCTKLQLNKEKDFARLMKHLEENPSSHSIQSLDEIELKLQILQKAKNGPSMVYSKVNHMAIKNFQESDIREWIHEYKSTKHNWNTQALSDTMKMEILAVVLRGIFLKLKFHLRDTQVLSCVMFLFKENKGLLQQIATGEGKSIIIVALAITQTLLGKKTDIITSSSVLAKRDAEINQSIYDLFSVTVDHITSADVDTRRKAYRGDVVYGDLGSFQRDILLTSFYAENVLGDRPPLHKRVVIVDEVDSMLLDQGQNVLYLSHNIPDLDGLEQLYVYIWSFVHSANTIGTDEDIHEVCQAILDNTFGLVRKHDIALLLCGLNPLTDISPEEMPDVTEYESEVQTVWQYLVDSRIIQNDGTITSTANIMNNRVKWKKNNSFSSEINGNIVTFLKNKARQGQCINVPNSLNAFMKRHLKEWVSNAFQARCMQEGHHYIIDIDRSEVCQRKNANITIIDLDTGVAQYQSQWNHGLHQFLQLKHGCAFNPESLKAVFMSNIMFFQQYETSLCGLSGTLGSMKERNLLKELYDVDFVNLPRFIHSNFTLKHPTFAPSRRLWTDTIIDRTNEITKCNQRPVLIVCETIKDVERLSIAFEKNNLEQQSFEQQNLEPEQQNVDEQKLEHQIIKHQSLEQQRLEQQNSKQQISGQESLKKQGNQSVPVYLYNHAENAPDVMKVGVTSACVVIATNLAGRGADIKISDDINSMGGLHVILAYLPDSSRVEMQAFGRAARKGQNGSGELIVSEVDEDVDMFELEDERASKEEEHLDKIKNQYENITKHEEDLFKVFQKAFISIRRKIEQEKKIQVESKTIVMDSLKDKWALWLDSVQERICKANVDELQKDLQSKVIKPMIMINKSNLIDALVSTPYLVRYAKTLIEKKEFKESLKAFDSAIENEPSFSEIAYYYKTHAVIRQGNSSTQSITSILKKAKLAMENRMSMWSSLSTIVSTIGAQYAEGSMESFITSDDYQKQKEEQVSIYSSYIKSIDDIIGHEVTVQKIESCPLEQRAAAYALQKLTGAGLLTEPCCGDASMQNLHLKQYELYSKEVKNMVKSFTSDQMKTVLPSREDFWQCLVEVGILQQEKEYIIIDKELAKQYKDDQDVFLKNLNAICGKSHPRDDVTDMISLYPEYLPQVADDKAVLLTKQEFESQIGKMEYTDSLLTSGLLKHTRFAYFNKEKEVALPRYDGISPADFDSIPGINSNESKDIFQLLQKSDVLSSHCPATLLQKDICDIHIDEYWSISSEIENVLRKHFQYRLALYHVQHDAKQGFPPDLALTPHIGLYEVLVNENALKPVMVNVNINVDEVKSKVEAALKVSETDNCHEQAIKACFKREALGSLLQTYFSTLVREKPDSKLKPVEECFDGSYRSSLADEFAALERNGLDSMISVFERKWTWKTIGKIIGILLLGFAQIVAGVILEVFTLGAGTFVAQGLIGEGIGDIQFAIDCAASGYCSMKDYLIHKAISVAFTVATAGVGALYSRGAKFSRFGYKIGGKSMSKLGGKELFDQTGKVIKDKLVKGQVVRVTRYRLATEVGKRVLIKTAEAVCTAAVNKGIDYAVQKIMENFIEDLIESTIKKEKIKKDIMKHESIKILERMYKLNPEVCMSLVENMKPGETSSWETNIMKGIGSVTSALGQSVKKLDKCGNKAKMISKLLKILQELPKLKIIAQIVAATDLALHSKKTEIAARKQELERTDNMLNNAKKKAAKIVAVTHLALHSKKTEIAAKKQELECTSDMLDDTTKIAAKKQELDSFLEKVSDQWATEIHHQVGSLTGQLLNEVMQSAVNQIIDAAKSGIKKGYGKFKEKQQLRKHQKLQEAHIAVMKQSEGKTSKQEQHTKDYYRKLNALASESKSPKLIMKVIQEGAPAGIHALQAMANIKGVSIEVKIIDGDNTRLPSVVHPTNGPTDKKLPIEFKAGKDGAAGHFYSPTGDSSARSPHKYDCLFDAVGISRKDVVQHIGQNKSIQNDIRSGFHRFFDATGGVQQTVQRQNRLAGYGKADMDKMKNNATYLKNKMDEYAYFIKHGELKMTSRGGKKGKLNDSEIKRQKRETKKSKDNLRDKARITDNAERATGNHELIPIKYDGICTTADYIREEKGMKKAYFTTQNNERIYVTYTEGLHHLRVDTKWLFFNNNGNIQGHENTLRNAAGDKTGCHKGSQGEHNKIGKNLARQFDTANPDVSPCTAAMEALRTHVQMRCSALDPKTLSGNKETRIERDHLKTAHGKFISNDTEWNRIQSIITKEVKRIMIVAQHLNGGKPLKWDIPFIPKLTNDHFEQSIHTSARKCKAFTDFCRIIQKPMSPD